MATLWFATDLPEEMKDALQFEYRLARLRYAALVAETHELQYECMQDNECRELAITVPDSEVQATLDMLAEHYLIPGGIDYDDGPPAEDPRLIFEYTEYTTD
jgi:hypothetical protein